MILHISSFTIILIAGIVLLFNVFILIPIAYCIIGRKYDSYFKSVVSIIDPRIPVFSQVSRTISYCGCIFFSSWPFLERLYKKNEYLQDLYTGYDFYQNALKSEIIIANVIYISLVLSFIMGILGLTVYKF